MSRLSSHSLKIYLISLVSGVFLVYAEALTQVTCGEGQFQCANLGCVRRSWFCDKANDCGDGSDEEYCNVPRSSYCPPSWFRCIVGNRCIPPYWKCDRTPDCPDGSDETSCRNNTSKTTDENSSKRKLKSWFLQRRKSGSGSELWGSEVHRIAVALHLADESTFSPGNRTGEEIRYELTIQLLQRFAKDKNVSTQELALYIHALLVSCMNPRDFYREDLVQELRNRVETGGNYTDPYLILALCNAGDTMTLKDVERMNAAYDSQHRPFWTDSQALASMALACIYSRSSESVDERNLRDMLQELKKLQFRNGTVDNYRTTALVTQALFIHESYKTDFDLDSAIKVLVDGLNGSMSLLNAYYALPVINRKSLLNVTSGHCKKEPIAEEEALQKVLDIQGETITVQYSVWMGDAINFARSWRLRLRVNSTIYDAIETIAKIDNRQKVEYNIVDRKPYVTALNGKEDDPEMGMYWFVYLKTQTSDKDPKMVEESPVDIKLKSNEEIILWYKRGPWSCPSPMQKPVRSP